MAWKSSFLLRSRLDQSVTTMSLVCFLVEFKMWLYSSSVPKRDKKSSSALTFEENVRWSNVFCLPIGAHVSVFSSVDVWCHCCHSADYDHRVFSLGLIFDIIQCLPKLMAPAGSTTMASSLAGNKGWMNKFFHSRTKYQFVDDFLTNLEGFISQPFVLQYHQRKNLSYLHNGTTLPYFVSFYQCRCSFPFDPFIILIQRLFWRKYDPAYGYQTTTTHYPQEENPVVHLYHPVSLWLPYPDHASHLHQWKGGCTGYLHHQKTCSATLWPRQMYLLRAWFRPTHHRNVCFWWFSLILQIVYLQCLFIGP